MRSYFKAWSVLLHYYLLYMLKQCVYYVLLWNVPTFSEAILPPLPGVCSAGIADNEVPLDEIMCTLRELTFD